MKIATCQLESLSPYSQSRSYEHEIAALDRETKGDYEERTWRNKCHSMPDGKIFIPPMSFKQGLDTAAKMLGMKIPGKRNSTYSKFFTSGVLVMQPLVLPMTKEQTACDRIFANADGVRGSGKRVWRNFPRIDKWAGPLEFNIIADEITKDVFEEHLRQAGSFVGVGRFRPANGGFYGRYQLKAIKWA